MIYFKIAICVMMLAWCWIGFYMVTNFKRLFGAHADDPSETSGARSYGIAHVLVIWFSVMALLGFFLSL
ncbi:MAG: hypothetical protein ACSHX0_13650 [Akkermansiaceae bacterium]